MLYTDLANLPFPEDSDPLGSIASTVNSLAEAIADPVALPLVLAAGWSLDNQFCFRLLGDMALFIQFQVTRTGANIVAGSNGNFGNTDIATINDAALRPVRNQYLSVERDGTATYKALLFTNGVVNVTHQTGANVDITTGSPYVVTGLVILK